VLALDFKHDALMCVRRLRAFHMVDDFNREALAIKINLNIQAQRVGACMTISWQTADIR